MSEEALQPVAEDSRIESTDRPGKRKSKQLKPHEGIDDLRGVVAIETKSISYMVVGMDRAIRDSRPASGSGQMLQFRFWIENHFPRKFSDEA